MTVEVNDHITISDVASCIVLLRLTVSIQESFIAQL